MAKTTIEWTDHSVNPIRARNKHTGATGHYCEKISSGCANCYASRTQPRFKMPQFPGVRTLPEPPVIGPNGAVSVSDEIEIFFDDSRLKELLRRRVPTKYFWCDMTDMFGAWVPDAWIDRCVAAMAMTPQHTHQVLTKRAERLSEHLNDFSQARRDGRGSAVIELGGTTDGLPWPMDNIWWGVSCENQQQANRRIPYLLRCPGAVRFLSCEPLLGPIDFLKVPDEWDRPPHPGVKTLLGDLDWVIVGGESGRGKSVRALELAWARSIRDQCRESEVPFFFKQTGSKVVGLTVTGKGVDLSDIPEDLRVREFPRRMVAA